MLVAFFRWWYGHGWQGQAMAAKQRFLSVADTFSIDLLFKTLFAPFRQISAEKTNGSLSVQFQGLIDRLFSRLIGAIVRFFMIILGIVALLITVVISGLLLLVWPLLPLVPLVCLFLTLGGYKL